MRTKALTGFLVWIAATLLCGTGWALDEAILTPTNDSVRSAEEEAFNSAIGGSSQVVSESGVYDAYENAVATYGAVPSFGYAGKYRYYADASSQLGKCPKPFNWKCAAYSAGVGALTGCAGKWVTGDAIEDIMMKVMLKLFGMDIGSACNNSYPVTWPPTKGF